MKLLKKLYSEDCQSLVSEAIEGLEEAPVGSSASDDTITVTKTGEQEFQITDNSEVALVTKTEGDNLNIVEADAQYCEMVDGKMVYSAPPAASGKMKFTFSEGTAAPTPPEVVEGDEVEISIFTQTVSGKVAKVVGDNAIVELAENTSTPITAVTLPLSHVNVKKVKVFSTAKKFAARA